jgi:hypothetical protein
MLGVAAVLALGCGDPELPKPPAGGSESLVCSEVTPGPSPLRPLTRDEYDRTIEDLLGDVSAPAQGFPPENEVLGFRNNAAANLANPLLVEGYMNAAEALAVSATSERLELVAPCPSGDQTACGRSFVRDLGTRAYRRPITEAEATSLDALFDAFLPISYVQAVQVTLTALLQSPQFLYRIDSWRAPTEQTGALLASRLSYLLTGSMPDAELFAAAAEGRLATAEEIELQARRLIETPRARDVMRSFHEQWLGLSLLDGVARIAEDVPAPAEGMADPVLVQSWRESFRRFVDHAVWNEGTVSALLTSPMMFVDQKLAPLYGESAPSEDFLGVERPDRRAGLLTQPALLALLAHSDQSAPVLRGVFVRERIMCIEIIPPPPTVNAVPPPVDPSATTRERFAQHTADPVCAGCHQLIDGLGFGFERYDQFGRYRTEENGLPVDESGEVVGTEDLELDGPYNGAIELANRLATSSRVRDCLATSFYRFAMGRTETDADQCSLDQVKQRFSDSHGAFNELLVAVTLSDAFRYRAAEGP